VRRGCWEPPIASAQRKPICSMKNPGSLDDRVLWVDPASSYRSRSERAGELPKKARGSSPGAASARSRCSIPKPMARPGASSVAENRRSG
jgi:hypothetical protein